MQAVLEACFKGEYEIEQVTSEEETGNYSIQAAAEPKLYRGLNEILPKMELSKDGQIDYGALNQANKDLEEAKQPEPTTKKAARAAKKAKNAVEVEEQEEDDDWQQEARGKKGGKKGGKGKNRKKGNAEADFSTQAS